MQTLSEPSEREIRLYYYTIHEVTQLCRLGKSAISKLILSGKLEATRVGTRWMIRPGQIHLLRQ